MRQVRKDEIGRLQVQLNMQRGYIQELRRKVWILENPPEYKRGEKVWQRGVTSPVEVLDWKIESLCGDRHFRSYLIRVVNGEPGETSWAHDTNLSKMEEYETEEEKKSSKE